MPTYAYEALTKDGSKKKGTLEAASPSDAEAKLRADAVTRLACELVEGRRETSGEEDRVADGETELLADGFGALRADILGDGPCSALFAFAPEDVAEAGLALLLGP